MVLSEEETWQREVAALQRPGGPAEHVLVARETAGRTGPGGSHVVEAWRYLAGFKSD